MKKSKRTVKAARRPRVFRAAAACVLLGVGVVTAVAGYGSRDGAEAPRAAQTAVAVPAKGGGFVTVEVGGKKIQVNAQTLQQGPLTQEQSQSLADALKDNKSTEGLVEVRHADGSVSMDLNGRFQNVTVAKRNEDGTISTACVDTPEAAAGFLNDREARPATTGNEAPRKGAVRE